MVGYYCGRIKNIKFNILMIFQLKICKVKNNFFKAAKYFSLTWMAQGTGYNWASVKNATKEKIEKSFEKK